MTSSSSSRDVIKQKTQYLIKCQSCHYMETSQLICYANQLTGFYMMATLAFNEIVYIPEPISEKACDYAD